MRMLERTRTGLMVVGMALVLGGCGSGDAIAPGERIQTKVIQGSDGSSVFVGLYDSELKTDCAYTLAADAKLRCLPLPSPLVDFIWSDDVHFSDPACTMAVGDWEGKLVTAGVLAPTPPAFGVVVFDTDPELELTHVYPFQGIYQGDGHGYYHDVDDDNCKPYDLDSTVYVQFGAEMPASSFVDGTDIIE